ncbi:hypothetical protein [Escherichia coli]
MRISNIEWLKKRIGFIRKLGEQTARQRQIIDLLDNEAGLTEQERKLLHVLATAEKNDLQAQESERKQAVQKRIEGKKQRRERNHRLFLAAGLLIEAGLVDTKTGELCYKKDRILQALKEIKESESGDVPNPRRRRHCLHNYTVPGASSLIRSLRSVMRLRRARPPQSCGKPHHCWAERRKPPESPLLEKDAERRCYLI